MFHWWVDGEPNNLLNRLIPVGAAAGCDLLILFFQKQNQKIVRTRPEPAAAPTGGVSIASEFAHKPPIC
jgi:hypothetical protein